MTYRIVTESGARVAGLETGELQAVEDVPTKAQADLKKNNDITLLPLENWWVHIMLPNTSFPPTDNLAFRKAVQAALDMDEIMDASTDGAYKLNIGFQYPGRASYTDAGKETYNVKNKDLAKKYLQEAGYKGEPLILLTNKDYTSMYNAALVVSEQLKAVGINAKLDVVDWPTTARPTPICWRPMTRCRTSSIPLQGKRRSRGCRRPYWSASTPCRSARSPRSRRRART